jgi:hypothetical protein
MPLAAGVPGRTTGLAYAGPGTWLARLPAQSAGGGPRWRRLAGHPGCRVRLFGALCFDNSPR